MNTAARFLQTIGDKHAQPLLELAHGALLLHLITPALFFEVDYSEELLEELDDRIVDCLQEIKEEQA